MNKGECRSIYMNNNYIIVPVDLVKIEPRQVAVGYVLNCIVEKKEAMKLMEILGSCFALKQTLED